MSTTKGTWRAADPLDDEWISAEKAADVLGVSESTVHRIARRGLIERGSGYRRYPWWNGNPAGGGVPRRSSNQVLDDA